MGASILRQILFPQNTFSITITQVLLRFSMPIGLVIFIYRREIVPTLREKTSHIGELMSYWLNHVVPSNTTQKLRFALRNLTQKKKKSNEKLNVKRLKTLGLRG